MDKSTDTSDAAGQSRRKSHPMTTFNLFGDGPEEEPCSSQKRRILTRVWLILLITNIALLVGISVWAVRRSHEKEQANFGKCFLAPTYPEDRRVNKNVLTIANFNAEWLFMNGGHGDIRCPSESCPWATTKEAKTHLKRVAQVIAELDADIVNLNEVEDCDILEALVAALPKGHRYKYYMVQGDDVSTGQNPAVLTRVDPVENLKHSKQRVNFPIRGSTCDPSIVGVTGCTKHYITRFIPRNAAGKEVPFTMVGLHLLAKPFDRHRCGRREAQASVIRQVVQEHREAGDRIVVAGDFNDFDNETIGASGEESITKVLPLLKLGLGLVNTASSVPIQERYSCWFDKDQNCKDNGQEEHTLIDHVLVSKDWRILQAAFHHKYTVSCRDRVSDHWPFKVILSLA